MRGASPTRRCLWCLGGVAAGAAAIAACTSNDPATIETLPPIRTTTSTTTTTTPPTTRPKTYEIQLGEALFTVAQRFGLTVTELAAYNGIENPDDVQAGQVIRLPPEDPGDRQAGVTTAAAP